jgi:hypothetical protein
VSRQANIRDIQALSDLKAAFGRFGEDVLQILPSLQKHFEDIEERLEERQRYWGQQVDQARDELREARHDLHRCQGRAHEDDEYVDCSSEEERVSDAERWLAEYEENWEMVKQWRHRIESQIADFHNDIHRLSILASTGVGSVQGFLAGKLQILELYIDSNRADSPVGLRVQSEHNKLSVRGRSEVTDKVLLTRRHHPWPKYLGGDEVQPLVDLPTVLHAKYHGGLDRILPRQKGTAYYESLPAAAKRQAYRDLADYTKAFDNKYGTRLYDAMIGEGFPQYEE